MKHKVSSCWTQGVSVRDSLSILTDLARRHAAKSGRFANDLMSLLDRQDFRGIVDYELSYLPSDNPVDLANARQALAFFQKFEPLDIGVDKRTVAFEKFIQSEAQCKATNESLRCRSRPGYSIPDLPVEMVLYHAERKISHILGDVPSLESLDFRFGPGANTTVKAKASSPRFKLGAKLACSSELANSVQCLLAEFPAWVMLHAFEDDEDFYRVNVEIDCGKLQFVPKNAKTYRSIVVEPILNSVAQKGIGTYLRDRLHSAGVNLRDQTRNQSLARSGSISDKLATIDLSSASDTISIELVRTLLPYEWFSFLSRFRTGKVRYHSDEIILEKFSSMGNAYTFELESLIFWGLVVGACKVVGCSLSDASVYGDDIVVPVEAFSLLERTLRYCGFSLNLSKSFASGPFRESCGTDWFLGIDIRPFYQKILVSGETLFSLHNFYARGFDFESCRYVREFIPDDICIYGPDGFGDGHLIASYEPRTRKSHISRGWAGHVFDTYVHRKVRITKLLPGDYALPAYSIYVLSDGEESVKTDHFVVRGSRGFRRVSIYTLRSGIFF